MVLPTDIKVALTLLQIIGLLIPVIFVAIRPFASQDSARDANQQWKTLRRQVPMIDADSVPDVVVGGLAVTAALGVAAILAATRVLQYLWGSWLITGSVLFLIVGILGLGGLVYLIRLEFKANIEVV